MSPVSSFSHWYLSSHQSFSHPFCLPLTCSILASSHMFHLILLSLVPSYAPQFRLPLHQFRLPLARSSSTSSSPVPSSSHQFRVPLTISGHRVPHISNSISHLALMSKDSPPSHLKVHSNGTIPYLSMYCRQCKDPPPPPHPMVAFLMYVVRGGY